MATLLRVYGSASLLVAVLLFAGCGSTNSAVPDPAPASESVGEQAAAPDPSPLPEGVLHFGGFEPGNPQQCAYLDRPRPDLAPEAEAWLAEREIGPDGFPINLYGEGTPSWAEGRTVFVYCESEG